MGWMAWTWPTALFFIGIGAAVAAMTIVELRWPTQLRKGWLPMPTTRGDRFFISLLAAACLHIAALAFGVDALWLASMGAVALGAAILRWG